MTDLTQTQALYSKLSDREMEILQDIAAGLSTKEIAEKRNISINTVWIHTYHAKKKTGYRNTINLIVECIRANLI